MQVTTGTREPAAGFGAVCGTGDRLERKAILARYGCPCHYDW